jgi:riboflavin synthase
MFTGIIEETGSVAAISHGAKSSGLTIKAARVLEDIKIGDSISTNGVCLTVTGFGSTTFTADVMPETIRRTTFSTLKPGSMVNLERALRLTDRIGGHLMSGHIDGTGKIIGRKEEDNAVWLMISVQDTLLRYIAEKGSVAIDGISLTVADTDSKSFRVSIIPHTREITTLSMKKQGDLVNIECDILAKYLEKLQQRDIPKGNISLGFLAENDF